MHLASGNGRISGKRFQHNTVSSDTSYQRSAMTRNYASLRWPRWMMGKWTQICVPTAAVDDWGNGRQYTCIIGLHKLPSPLKPTAFDSFMKKFILAVLLILSVQTLRSQQVSNVRFDQSGKQVVITYDLAGDASSSYTISLYYCISDGPWQGPVKSVIGNVGPGQKTGNGKKITWSVLDELDKLTGEIRFKVQPEVVFGDNSDGSSGTFTDARDGKTYKTIRIGNQVWMAENLGYLPTVSHPKTGSEKEKFYYIYGVEIENANIAKLLSNYSTYRVLYNWPAALTACPSGWHLPSDAEWTTLTNFLGTAAGGKMKETGTTHWNSPNMGATNASGFAAFPGGNRSSSGGFGSLGYGAYFWSSSEYDASHAWDRGLYYGIVGVDRDYDTKSYGFSARCLQN